MNQKITISLKCTFQHASTYRITKVGKIYGAWHGIFSPIFCDRKKVKTGKLRKIKKDKSGIRKRENKINTNAKEEKKQWKQIKKLIKKNDQMKLENGSVEVSQSVNRRISYQYSKK